MCVFLFFVCLFVLASCSWQFEGLWRLSPYLHPFRHLEGSLAWGPSLLLHTSGTERGPPAGIVPCRSVHQALKGAPWVGSYSVVQCVWCLMGQPLYCSAAMLACGEREAMVMAPPRKHDSEVSPCFHGCLAPALPTTISSLTSPQSVSPQSTSALALGLLHNP